MTDQKTSYTVKLTVDGRSYSQPIVVRQDPRVKTSELAMAQVYSLTKAMYYGAVDAQRAELVDHEATPLA